LVGHRQATFMCGQLLVTAPALVSRLPAMPRVLRGLGCALRVGWDVNAGVAKFAANALCEFAVSDAAGESAGWREESAG
jgi:hypothetical protein